MSHWFAGSFSVLWISLLASSALAKAHLRGPMDALQVVPPNGSPATGLGQYLIDTNTDTVFFHLSYSGLSGSEINPAFIHGYAAPGEESDIVFEFPVGNPKVGAWFYSEADEENILAGLAYAEVRSTSFPDGEIRGQIVVEPATDILSLLNGSQEVPPVFTPGLGIGVYDIDTAANTLSFDIRYGMLAGLESQAHFHQAPPGVNGGIVFTLPLDSPKIGVWNYSQALESDILAGNIYANVHSSLSPTGEIRGQFESPSPAVGVNVTFPGSNTDLSLFAAPNPLPHDNLALFYRAPEGEMITVEIVDVNGRVVRSLPDVQSSRTGILAWDTLDKNGAKVAGGMYFARLRAGAAETTTRFVVLR